MIDSLSDGCTGVPFFHHLWPGSYQCCYYHDMGGSDFELFTCWLAANVPWWIAVPAMLVMMSIRPLYRLVKPWIDPHLKRWFGRTSL